MNAIGVAIMLRLFEKPIQLAFRFWLALGTWVYLAQPLFAQSAPDLPAQAEDGRVSPVVIVGPIHSGRSEKSSVTISQAADLVGRPLEPLIVVAGGGPIAALLSALPVEGARLTSGIGPRIHPITGQQQYHRGVDLAVPTGTSVRVAAGGTVVRAGWAGGYGNLVAIDHGGGVETRYAHLSRIDVQIGDQVAAGHKVGLVGSTGNSTGPHLHYEVLESGKPINPMAGPN